MIKRSSSPVDCNPWSHSHIWRKDKQKINMREASMGEIDHAVILNEEYTSRDATRFLLAQYDIPSPHENAQLDITRDENASKEGFESDSQVDKHELPSCHCERDSLKKEIAELKQNMLYVSHQVTLLMNALHVPACNCENCKPKYQTQIDLFAKMKEATKNLNLMAKPDSKAETVKIEAVENGHSQTQATSHFEQSLFPSANGNVFSGIPNMSDCEALLSQIFTQSAVNGVGFAGLTNALGINTTQSINSGTTTPPGGVTPTSLAGRKSKYCSPAEKRAVAEYANTHGASAAARKFKIPPPVAAYYHRKEYKHPRSSLTSQIPSGLGLDSPGTTSGDDMESMNDEALTNQQSVSGSGGLLGVTEMFKQMEQHQKTNPAHSSGSPGFLRGRGRGRPKLIGDELDAELVEYMVQVKQADPQRHLTASQALSIARDYILEKAPGLLEEHGGQIKLKLTWAMKLVSRIGERQKEIELGLPAGALSNISRGNINVPGGNFMAEMLTHNILNQHINQVVNFVASEDASSAIQTANVPETGASRCDNGGPGRQRPENVISKLFVKQEIEDSRDDDDDMDSQTSVTDDAAEGIQPNDNNGRENLISATNF